MPAARWVAQQLGPSQLLLTDSPKDKAILCHPEGFQWSTPPGHMSVLP